MTDYLTIDEYEEKRKELVEKNSNLLGVVLRPKEIVANDILNELKGELYKSYKGNVPYNVPTLSDNKLTKSKLYKFCSLVPKGGDLHVHDMALLPAKELIKLLLTEDGFYINADKKNYDLKFTRSKAPKGYLPFSDAVNGGYYTANEIEKAWTFSSGINDDKTVWESFENLFSRHSALSDSLEFVEDYYDYAFRYLIKNKIYHVEIHIMLTEGLSESEKYLKRIRSAYYRVKKEYPFFTVKMIGAGVKADGRDIKLTKRCFLNTAYAQETIKDESDENHVENFIIGFDLVNEEDGNLPLKAFVPMLLKVKRRFPEMNLFIHGGESINAVNENLIDAYLLGVKRVGHGLNLYRYPDLHKKFIKSEICLEVCPISNVRLLYTKDIRNHPATEYLRSGVAMSICSDDPTYMENETLTDDFFSAIIGWDIGVAEIKQLGINSIVYSGLTKREKSVALKHYDKEWNNFIDDLISGRIVL